MSDETKLERDIASLQEDNKELLRQVAELTSLITNTLERDIKRIDNRLDRHSDRLDILEETRHQAITTKNMVVWIVSTLLSSVAIAVSLVKWLLTGN